MKVLCAVLLGALILGNFAEAGSPPWYNNEEECHQAWFNKGTGCRIRKENYFADMGKIEGEIVSAEAARDALVAPKETAAVNTAVLIEKKRDLEEVFVPHLEAAVQLCDEIKSGLMASGKDLAKLMGIVGLLKLKAGPAGPEFEKMAALSSEAVDEIALSMILDEGTRKIEKAKTTVLRAVPNAKVSFSIVISILEENAGAMTQAIQNVVGTLGKLYALNAAELVRQKKLLELLSDEARLATEKRDLTKKAFEEADARYRERKQYKANLPGLVASEQACESDALGYWTNSNLCSQHYHVRTEYSGDRGQGGASRDRL